MTARLPVIVTARSSRDQVAGWRGEELWVRVAAVPDRGRANAAVCALVAGALGVAKSSVRVARGHTSRHKVLEIEGVSIEALHSAFGDPHASGP